MDQKLIELIRDAGECTPEELAEHLAAAGVIVPVRCLECKCYDPGFVRPYLGWCNNYEAIVNENGYCYHGERRC